MIRRQIAYARLYGSVPTPTILALLSFGLVFMLTAGQLGLTLTIEILAYPVGAIIVVSALHLIIVRRCRRQRTVASKMG